MGVLERVRRFGTNTGGDLTVDWRVIQNMLVLAKGPPEVVWETPSAHINILTPQDLTFHSASRKSILEISREREA